MIQEFFTMSSNITIIIDQNALSNADYNIFFGTGGPDDPLVAFYDKERLISSEQYSYHGRWRGWKHEVIENEKEYFRRKLKGK